MIPNNNFNEFITSIKYSIRCKKNSSLKIMYVNEYETF